MLIGNSFFYYNNGMPGQFSQLERREIFEFLGFKHVCGVDRQRKELPQVPRANLRAAG